VAAKRLVLASNAFVLCDLGCAGRANPSFRVFAERIPLAIEN